MADNTIFNSNQLVASAAEANAALILTNDFAQILRAALNSVQEHEHQSQAGLSV